MAFRPSVRLALVGAVLALLSFVFTGVLSRPLLAVGLWFFAWAALDEQREAKRRLRVLGQEKAWALVLGVILMIGLTGFWASQPFFRRHALLTQFQALSAEGRQLESALSQGVAVSYQQGDTTARIKDWHARVEGYVTMELGLYYKERLGTPQQITNYPAELPSRFRVLWDIIETDVAALETFHQEFSPWLF